MTGASLQMTVEKAQKIPPVVDVPTAAAILGIGRTAAYELIRLGKWPTPILRLGKLIRIPSAPLLELVQVQRRSTAPSPSDTPGSALATRTGPLHRTAAEGPGATSSSTAVTAPVGASRPAKADTPPGPPLRALCKRPCESSEPT